VASGRLGVLLVLAVVFALAIWRLAYVLAGIDPDTDAYGHHTIARQILQTPRDLTVHWVWLPLLHYLQAGAIVLGATLQTVRFFNIGASAAVPLVLYLLLLRNRRGASRTEWDPAPAIAAILCALSPIAMQMGTTRQTEPIFALLVVSLLLALHADRVVLATVLLTSAVLMRYEAWAIPPALALLLIGQRAQRAQSGLRGHARWTPWLVVLVPLAAILAWASLRHLVERAPWFSFLRDTRTFANGALGAKSSLEHGAGQLLRDLRYYAVDVPWRCVGYPLVLAPFGVARTLRREGARFFLVYLALLAFVTLTWVLRSSLGLDRHFVVLVPFYATLMANGVIALGEAVHLGVRRAVGGSQHAFLAPGAARAAVIAGLAFAGYATSYGLLQRWMRDFRNASEQAWPDRRAVAAFLAALPVTPEGGPTIFCDEPTVEVLSGLDGRRFDRRSLDAPEAKARIAAASLHGEVYVATWAAKALLLDKVSVLAFRPPGATARDEGLVVLRAGTPVRLPAQ
jgi:hypothetical protein